MELRQQLSSDSLFLLEAAAKKEVERLKQLHWSVVVYNTDRKTIDGISRDIMKYEDAIRELHAVFLDQFEEGRKRNDASGKTGIKK